MKSTTATPNILLRQARELQGWSQKFVAEQIDAPATCYISRWERGHTITSLFYKEKLCRLFGKDARELGFFSEKEPLEATMEGPDVPAFAQSPISSSKVQLFESSAPPTIPAPGLFGRQEICQLLAQKLCTEPERTIVALYGLPGVGKTSLARICMHTREIRQHFPDGILWIHVGTQLKKTQILAACSAAFGLPKNYSGPAISEEQQVQAISQALHSRHMLLIIDDIWDAEDFLFFFNMGGIHCTYLFTTRLPAIAKRLTKQALAVCELEEKEGLELLESFVPDLIHQETQIMSALVRSVDGLPLALTSIGQYLRSHVQGEQPRRIQAALESLSQPEGRLRLFEQPMIIDQESDLSHQPAASLWSILETSDQHLSLDAQQALYALAIFPAKPKSFSQQAALTITDVPLEILNILIDTGLLEEGSAKRYTLHSVVIDYVRSKYVDREAQDRLTDYVLHYLEQNHDIDEKLDWELDILLAGLEMMLERQHTHKLLRTLSLFAPFLCRKGMHVLSEKYLQQAYQIIVPLQEQPQTLQFMLTIICYLAKSRQKRGSLAQARVLYQQGLNLVLQCDDPQAKCDLLLNLGTLEFEQGIYLQAEAYFQQALIEARRYNYHKLLVVLLSHLGDIVAKRGNYSQAQAYFQTGLALAHQYGYPEWLSTLLTNLGQISYTKGAYIEAYHYLQPGLEIARKIAYSELICTTLVELAHLTIEQGNYTQAEAYLQEGLVLIQQSDPLPLLNCKILHALARLAIKQEYYAKAQAFLQEGQALAYQAGYLESQCQLCLLSGIVEIELHNYIQAEMYLQKGLALAYQLGHSECISGTLIYLGITAAWQQRIQQAEAYLQEGLAIARSIEKKEFQCIALHMLGEYQLLHHNREKAALYFSEMLEIASPSNQEHLAKAQYGMARIAQAQGNITEAHKLGQVALALSENLGTNYKYEIHQWLSSLFLVLKH